MINASAAEDDPANKGVPRAVFLSYASEDAVAAERIYATLRTAGIEVWFDRSEMRGGDVWDAATNQQIKTCTLFMPIISAHSQARPEGYFRVEWNLAVDRSQLMAANRPFLVPVVIDGTANPDYRVPDRFREVQWIVLPEGEVPPPFVQRIARLLAHPAANQPEAEVMTPVIARPPSSNTIPEVTPVDARPPEPAAAPTNDLEIDGAGTTAGTPTASAQPMAARELSLKNAAKPWWTKLSTWVAALWSTRR